MFGRDLGLLPSCDLSCCTVRCGAEDGFDAGDEGPGCDERSRDERALETCARPESAEPFESIEEDDEERFA